jgi:hypothetical protein
VPQVREVSLKAGVLVLAFCSFGTAPGRDDVVELSLTAELKKGAHFYDIPDIREQRTQALRPLTDGM